MKLYTITNIEDNFTDDDWSDLFQMVEYSYQKKESIDFQTFLQREKSFLKVVENFLEYFETKDICYIYNKTMLDYKETLEYALDLEIAPEKDMRHIVKTAHTLAMTDMDAPIKKSYISHINEADKPIFIKTKEEALNTMHLNFRSLLSTDIRDNKTKSYIDTGNSGLYLTICIPNNIDITILLENTKGLKYILDDANWNP